MASMDATAPAAPATKQAAAGIDSADINGWTERFGAVLSKPSEHLNNKSPEGSKAWVNGLFGCFTPIDTCRCCQNQKNAS